MIPRWKNPPHPCSSWKSSTPDHSLSISLSRQVYIFKRGKSSLSLWGNFIIKAVLGTKLLSQHAPATPTLFTAIPPQCPYLSQWYSPVCSSRPASTPPEHNQKWARYWALWVELKAIPQFWQIPLFLRLTVYVVICRPLFMASLFVLPLWKLQITVLDNPQRGHGLWKQSQLLIPLTDATSRTCQETTPGESHQRRSLQ